jgi:hypothetical protein
MTPGSGWHVMRQSSLVELTERQREFLQFLADRDRVDLREVNAVMGWSDEERRVTTGPLTKDGLVTLTLSIPAFVARPSPGPSPGWWEITNPGRELLGLTPKPI